MAYNVIAMSVHIIIISAVALIFSIKNYRELPISIDEETRKSLKNGIYMSLLMLCNFTAFIGVAIKVFCGSAYERSWILRGIFRWFVQWHVLVLLLTIGLTAPYFLMDKSDYYQYQGTGTETPL